MELSEIIGLLKEPKSIVITAHRSPDGDAVGSSLGLYHFLLDMGHDVAIVLPDGYPHFLHWMPGHSSVVIAEDNDRYANELIFNAQLLFCLDYNHLSRVGVLQKLIADSSAVKVMIDHHRDPDHFADFMISDITSCSTAQLIYDFIVSLDGEGKISAETAECLYTGIMTDSGSFRYNSTTAKTHMITAKLIENGANSARIHDLVYDQNSLSKTKLWGYAMSKLELAESNRVGIISLTADELKKYDYRDGDTEGLVNQPLSIQGVEVSVFIREEKEMLKMSFRSKGDQPVNDMARDHFNGGGHLNAAGGSSQLSVEETVERVKELLPKYLQH